MWYVGRGLTPASASRIGLLLGIAASCAALAVGLRADDDALFWAISSQRPAAAKADLEDDALLIHSEGTQLTHILEAGVSFFRMLGGITGTSTRSFFEVPVRWLQRLRDDLHATQEEASASASHAAAAATTAAKAAQKRIVESLPKVPKPAFAQNVKEALPGALRMGGATRVKSVAELKSDKSDAAACTTFSATTSHGNVVGAASAVSPKDARAAGVGLRVSTPAAATSPRAAAVHEAKQKPKVMAAASLSRSPLGSAAVLASRSAGLLPRGRGVAQAVPRVGVTTPRASIAAVPSVAAAARSQGQPGRSLRHPSLVSAEAGYDGGNATASTPRVNSAATVAAAGTAAGAPTTAATAPATAATAPATAAAASSATVVAPSHASPASRGASAVHAAVAAMPAASTSRPAVAAVAAKRAATQLAAAARAATASTKLAAVAASTKKPPVAVALIARPVAVAAASPKPNAAAVAATRSLGALQAATATKPLATSRAGVGTVASTRVGVASTVPVHGPVTAVSAASCSVRSCRELGWPDAIFTGGVGVAMVCGHVQGSGSANISFAAAYCRAVGARLCTKVELLACEAVGRSGTALDAELVWSESACPGGFFAVRAGTNCAHPVAVCVPMGNTGHAGRCCADADPVSCKAKTRL
eukprot:TRINITY_DN9977_c0_g1_i2.p1 TRINITY_DN9977_c0_g1~~TRINITY_DN9977_c0_g1_i2.p1  ORF type:complete len:649 (-),score=98.43 TRINITY_DN9977_c0_g1_i2:322-2268(-)